MEIVNHPAYGPSLPEVGWVPAPRYLLRRSRILSWLQSLPTGSMLEVGCGAGTMLYETSKLGFQVEGFEMSAQAFEVAKQVNPGVLIHNVESVNWDSYFDYVCAFEVLEHIDDDVSVLNTWRSWLKPGGHLLLSVPAHMSKWGHTDVWAGHYRRYEKLDLINMFKSNGFAIERFESYGFPLISAVSILRNYIHGKELKKREALSISNQKSNNDQSGVSRKTESKLYPILKSPLGRFVMWSGNVLQNMTLKQDWGDGYLVLAKKI